MMKFFRKYDKQLLAVFMVLLMIVFIGGTALENLMRPKSNRVIGESKFGKVTEADQFAAASTTSILGNLGYRWQQLSGIADRPLTETDWILLNREAEQLDMASTKAAARSSLMAGLDAEQLDRFSTRLGVRPDHIYAAIAEYRSVQETASAMAAGTAPSAAEVRVAARDALNKVKIEAIVLPASALADAEQTFSDDELTAHFDTYKEAERGTGLNFGYYQQPELKAQYIKIDRDKVAEQIRVPNLARKAKAYYEKNQTDPAFDAHQRALDAGVDPADADEPGTVMPWWEAEEIAREIVKKQEAGELVSAMANWIIANARDRFETITFGEDRYRTAPPDVAQLAYYQGLITNLPKKLNYPDAVSVGQTEFFNAQDADSVPELGEASFGGAGGAGTLAVLAFRTKAIVPVVPRAQGVSLDDYLSTYQTCLHPLTGTAGHKYIFRVVDAKAGHPAEALADVRQRVIEDLRLLRGYERAEQLAETLQSAPSEGGLKQLHDSDAVLKEAMARPGGNAIGFVQPQPFARVSNRYFAAMGRPETGISVAGVGQFSNEDVDGCFALGDSDEKKAIVKLADDAKVVLVGWVETQEATVTEFDGLKTSLVAQMTAFRRRDAVTSWLDPDQIRARTEFNAILRR